MASAYYNEIDPYAAAWLRNLIAKGLIASGEVDERDIRDVRSADLAGFQQCHFFAGIGLWSHGLRLAGWPDDRPVWTGSCPCQPFSAAGKRRAYDDERHLAPAWLDLIAECAPSVVFGEQVATKAGRAWLSELRAEMEGLGYAVGAADLCAAGVGAPHIRQRLWWVADAERSEQPRQEPRRREAGRMGRVIKSVPWSLDWQSALRRFRGVDDGRSYGVATTDAIRNAIVPQVAAEFIGAYLDQDQGEPAAGVGEPDLMDLL